MKLYDLNQTDLAKRLGVSPQSVSYWCSGEKAANIEKIDKMCEIFHCQRSDLMEDKNSKSKEEPTVDYFYSDQHKIDMADMIIEVQDLSHSEFREVKSYVAFIKSRRKRGD